MQTLPSVLPPTEGGLHNTVQPSTKLILIAVSTWMTILGIGSQVGAYYLDKATAKQCLNHDWPKDAAIDQVHRDWCIGNGYKI